MSDVFPADSKHQDQMMDTNKILHTNCCFKPTQKHILKEQKYWRRIY